MRDRIDVERASAASLPADTLGHTLPEMKGLSTPLLQDEPLAEGAPLWHALFKNNIDAIFLLDAQGRFTDANAAAEQLSGYAADELVTMGFSELCAESDRQRALSFFARVLAGAPQRGELTGLCRDGSKVDISVTGTPIFSDEAVTGLFCTVRDVSKQRRLEEQLRHDSREAERAKDRFLAVLSHELRTPLMPVLTTVQMLESNQRAPVEFRDTLAMMRRNLELEARLIDDLLDLNRIRHGKLALYMQPHDLHERIRHVLELCKDQLFDKRLNVELHLDAGHAQVHADPGRIQQVLWNIIGNAVKFTPAGGTIRIQTCNGQEMAGPSCKLGSQSGCRGRMACAAVPDVVVVHVSDTGVGIDPQRLAQLFTAFERAGQEGCSVGGAGVGLAITKALVELHGGELAAYSEGPSKGAQFTITLPRRRPVVPEVETGPSATRRRRSWQFQDLLLVEDHPDTAKVLGLLLKGFGFRVTVAPTVQEGLALAKQKRFDLLISDIGLPDGTGADLVRQLREYQDIPAIALSGYGMEDDIRRSYEAGFADHLIKPINLRHLEATIERLLGCRGDL